MHSMCIVCAYFLWNETFIWSSEYPRQRYLNIPVFKMFLFLRQYNIDIYQIIMKKTTMANYVVNNYTLLKNSRSIILLVMYFLMRSSRDFTNLFRQWWFEDLKVANYYYIFFALWTFCMLETWEFSLLIKYILLMVVLWHRTEPVFSWIRTQYIQEREKILWMPLTYQKRGLYYSSSELPWYQSLFPCFVHVLE